MGSRGRKVEKGFVKASEARNTKEKLLRHAEKDAVDAEAKIEEMLSLAVCDETEEYEPQIGDTFVIVDDSVSGVFELKSETKGRVPMYVFVHVEHPWIRTTYTWFAFKEKFLGAESQLEDAKKPKTYIVLRDKY